MDSQYTPKKELEINIKDALQYIFYKGWIVILVTLFAVIISFLYTNVLLPEKYTSEAKLFVSNESKSDGITQNDFDLGKQYAISSAEFITIDFCQVIANKLNSGAFDCTLYIGNQSFKDFYKQATGYDQITANQLKSYINVKVNSNTNTVAIEAVTPNANLSAIVVNSVASSFEGYLRDMLDSKDVKAKVVLSGKIAENPSNVHTARNLALGFIIGFALSCGSLFIAFIVDDKIKSPEDVEKYLGLSVLGAIPEIEKEI